MNFYVASRFTDYKRVRRLVSLLESEGYRCTYDWTDSDEFDQNGDPKYATDELTEGAKRQYAICDVYGARKADMLIFLADQENYTGALIEVGIAMSNEDVEIHVVAPAKDSIFWYYPTVTIHDTLEDLYFYLVG